MFLSRLAENISRSGNRKVVVTPLADAKDKVDALGRYLSRQISETLKELAPEVEIINPENLHVKSQIDSGGQISESDIEELKQLAWSVGADICVLADFAPYSARQSAGPNTGVCPNTRDFRGC